MTTFYKPHKRWSFIWRSNPLNWFAPSYRRVPVYDKVDDVDFGDMTNVAFGPLYITYNHDPIGVDYAPS